MNTKKKLLTIFVIFVLLGINVSPVFAYSLNGGKWSTNNITFSDYTSGSYCWSAANDWDNPSGLSNRITLTAQSGSNFRVYETYNYGVAWDGICYYSISYGYFNWAFAYDNTYYTAYYTTSKHQGVVTHEMGHGLGLDDTSSYCVMYYSSANRYTTVQTDDNNGINALYY